MKGTNLRKQAVNLRVKRMKQLADLYQANTHEIE